MTDQRNHENLGIRADNTSGARGVSWDSVNRLWKVRVTHQGKEHWGGRFADLATANQAAIALRNRVLTNNVQDWK